MSQITFRVGAPPQAPPAPPRKRGVLDGLGIVQVVALVGLCAFYILIAH